MKIMFIDESKKVYLKKRKFFLLLGIVVDSEKMFKLESDLNNLRQEFNLDNFNKLKTNNLDLNTKKEICRRFKEILKNSNSFVLSIILGPIMMQKVRNFEDCYLEAIGFMIDRFFLNLNMSKDFGWIVHDTIEGSEKKFRDGFKNYVKTQIFSLPKWKSGYLISDRIHPCLSFFDDNECQLLQCSDLVALSVNNAIWKKIEDLMKHDLNINKLNEENEFLDIYWDLFPRNKNGEVNGAGIKIWY